MRITVLDDSFPEDHEWSINGIQGKFVNGVPRAIYVDEIAEGFMPYGANIIVDGTSPLVRPLETTAAAPALTPPVGNENAVGDADEDGDD